MRSPWPLAVLLLPVYTRYVTPTGYGVVETLATFVIFVSIVVRFGMIESFLRFYFSDEDPERRNALVRRAVRSWWSPPRWRRWPWSSRRPRWLAGHDDQPTLGLPGGGAGVWAFTNLELAYALLRVDERLRAYAVASVSNVALTVIASVILVVGFGQGALGLLIANYGAALVVLLGLWWAMRDRLRIRSAVSEPLSGLLHFGLPTVRPRPRCTR